MWTDIQTEVRMDRQAGMMKITGVFRDHVRMYLKPTEFIYICHFICMFLKNHICYRIVVVRFGISGCKEYVSHQMSLRKQKEKVKLCHPMPSPIKLSAVACNIGK